MSESPRRVYVVIWDCLNPQALAVFSNQRDALVFCDEYKARIDAVFKTLMLTGHERVYVWSAPLNPELPAQTGDRT